MEKPKIWSNLDCIEYVSIMEDHLLETVGVIRDSFYVDELVAVAVELQDNPTGRVELDELTCHVAKDGVSIAAIDKSTNKIVGVAVNKLHVKNSNFISYLKELENSFKEPSPKALVKFMVDADEACDLFKICQTDSILEVMFLTVIPEYRGRKIGRKLFELSIQLTKSLKSNQDFMKQPRKISNADNLPGVPKVVSAIFTSPITKKYGRDFGFKIAKEINYEKFTYNGKTFAERLACNGQTEAFSITIEYLDI